jgi:heat shock protein HslJ
LEARAAGRGGGAGRRGPAREPPLLLRPDGRRPGGFGGCNALAGGYWVDGERLEFGPVASTMMACPEGMDMEAAFFAALGQVWRWQVSGEHLEPSIFGRAAICPSSVTRTSSPGCRRCSP